MGGRARPCEAGPGHGRHPRTLPTTRARVVSYEPRAVLLARGEQLATRASQTHFIYVSYKPITYIVPLSDKYGCLTVPRGTFVDPTVLVIDEQGQFHREAIFQILKSNEERQYTEDPPTPKGRQ